MIHHGDLFDVLPTLGADSIDACVTDPPYELSFMGKHWDGSGVAFQQATWAEVYRVLKPGAHLLAFGGTRTFHRMTCAIEDAGFEIRDCLSWLYGQGFPKSLDVSKAMDKHGGQSIAWFGPWLRQERQRRGIKQSDLAVHFPSKAGTKTGCVANWELGYNMPTPEQFNLLCRVMDLPFANIEAAEREVVGINPNVLRARSSRGGVVTFGGAGSADVTAPATDLAKQWQGWGTALKPSFEPVIIARKPASANKERDIIVANLSRLEAQLWSVLPASIAVEVFRLSPAEHDAACVSAQWTADERCNTWADLFGQMDTSQSVSVMTSCLSTVTSWSGTLAEFSNNTSTSTIGTATNPTIDWPILKSSLLALTPRTIIQAAINLPGSWWSAVPAARYFHAVVTSISATLELSALAPAIAQARISCQDADAPDFNCGWEPIILARKPLTGTVAANVAQFGTGAINIDACRISGRDRTEYGLVNAKRSQGNTYGDTEGTSADFDSSKGRWPPNVCLNDRSAALLDEQTGELTSGDLLPGHKQGAGSWGSIGGDRIIGKYGGDSGGASRFFYCAKPSREERDYGLSGGRSTHPTVKPVELMRWLVRLVTPPGGLVLDPFAGSGTTGMACRYEQRRFIGIEREAEYVAIAERRIGAVAPLFGEESA